jgi:hypothetical protein
LVYEQFLYGFKRGYQLRNNLRNNENYVLLAHPDIVSEKLKKHFCKLLNVCGVNDIRQTVVHATELPEPSAYEIHRLYTI